MEEKYGPPMTIIAGIVAAGKKRPTIYIDIYPSPGAYIWTKRPKVKTVSMYLYGGGGGGGSGGFSTSSGTNPSATGGAGGMGGQVYFTASVSASLLKSTGTVFVGRGGNGAASVSTFSNGNLGADGINSFVEIRNDFSRQDALGGYGGERGRTGFVTAFNFVPGAQGGGYYGDLPPTYSGYGGNSKTATNVISDYPLLGFNGGVSRNTIPLSSKSLDPTGSGFTTTGGLYTNAGGGGGGGVTGQWIGNNSLRAGNGGNSIASYVLSYTSTVQTLITSTGGTYGFNANGQAGQTGTSLDIITKLAKYGNSTTTVYFVNGGGGGGGALGGSVFAGNGGNGGWPGGGGGGGGAVGYSVLTPPSTVPIRSGAGGKGGDGLVVIISYT